MMQGNGPPLVIPIRPSLAAVLDGQGKSHLTFVPRFGSPNGTAFSGLHQVRSEETRSADSLGVTGCVWAVTQLTL
jgi:hypothetical protein